VALATSPVIAVCAFVLWGIILAISHYVSLASMIAITAFALASLFFSGPWIGCNFLALALFIVYTHWPNIKRLCAGTEPKVGSKKGG
jgi:glycerol-3-phosphate acyltransferase PlsY